MSDADAYCRYLDVVEDLLHTARSEAVIHSVTLAAELIARKITSGGILYAFGASHAGLLIQDQFYRAGGLVPIQPILPAQLMLNTEPVTLTSELEQTPGFAEIVLKNISFAEGDLLLIASVSGRNPVAVEMCQLAQTQGATVIALTNVTYSSAVAGRHGDRLFEVADIVIDMPGVVGDAAIELLPGMPQVGPTSSAVGAAILHGLMVQVSALLIAGGQNPPVFASANMDNSAAWNDRLIDNYRNQLTYL